MKPGADGTHPPRCYTSPELCGSGKVAVLDHAPEGRAGEGEDNSEKLGLAYKCAVRQFVELVHVGRKYRLQ